MGSTGSFPPAALKHPSKQGSSIAIARPYRGTGSPAWRCDCQFSFIERIMVAFLRPIWNVRTTLLVSSGKPNGTNCVAGA